MRTRFELVLSVMAALCASAAVVCAHGSIAEVPPAAGPAVRAPLRCAPSSFEVVADSEELSAVIARIAEHGGARVRLIDGTATKVTLAICADSAEAAVREVARAARLSVRSSNDTLFVGHEADLIADLASSDDTTEIDTYYRCRHLDALTLVDLLKRLLPKELSALPGPQFISPTVQAVVPAGASIALASQGASFHTHDVILSGPTNLVKRAVVLARKLDRPRKQVRIAVQVTDVTSNALRELGITWGWGKIAIREDRSELQQPAGDHATLDLKLGRFGRSDITIEAKLTALEQKNQARLLTNAHLLVLDGERSYVLTGTKYVYPKLVSTNANGMPNYDITELKVGVYMQVAVQVGLDGDIVLSVYPQVSNVSSFTLINGAPYPVIATREQQTTVTVRSGQTLAIGGLKQEDSLRAGEKIPLLGSIPLIGKLFQYHNDSNDNSELVVLITPELVE